MREIIKRPTLMQFATNRKNMPYEFDMRSYVVSLNEYVDYLEKISGTDNTDNHWITQDTNQSGG